ncbi:purple acid phosphatase family protein [Limnofasciculus baicalensis]|uniref:Metallophosphoesterase n=1 Tax=Limnofasciculus baicalensis BBK-W-15 TaxID=2699891 RepID=A0AAE3KNI7_9CYAN|nr:metallophosphoesterase family protein [Limnofasciculus baicalensis]MCP2730394.1 metallophosphoesterase [Limnofasciculus baicalensis BBK-W-15]
MTKQLKSAILIMAAFLIISIALAPSVMSFNQQSIHKSAPQLLSDPFLQLPTETSVRVVWFTEFPGNLHTVAYGRELNFSAIANTTKLSRTREDSKSRVGNQVAEGAVYQKTTFRNIWRHEAEITGITPGKRVPYQVTSVREDGDKITSKIFTLSATPKPQTPLKILLTSDHQLKPTIAANLQKVKETIGQVDAVFFAGDLVNIPDRASEWFDDNRGGAFFPCLQGSAHYELDKNGVKTTYKGGDLIQNAPLFPVIGNHEVMGRFSMDRDLGNQLSDGIPRTIAEEIYQNNQLRLNLKKDPNLYQDWLKNNSFNTDTYQEIFTLPGEKKYYAITFGDIRLVSLYITNIWRSASLALDVRGKYQEKDSDLNKPERWGYGQHIFEPIKKGSRQYNWLERELNSPEFQEAKYKIVMFHHPAHSLGENIVPAYTDPVQQIERDGNGEITSVSYEYPKDRDYIIRDVIPLLDAAGVQLVLYGHSHLWNRFISPSGINFLESSNVGNSYGAYIGTKKRSLPKGDTSGGRSDRKNYAPTGDPNGLEPIVPTIAPLLGENQQPLPYIASNDITVFSILDTGSGMVYSYYFDTRQPESSVVKFDEFPIIND